MATQDGIIKISGKLGDLVFYQRREKHVSRMNAKPYKLTAATIKSGKDFGQASKNAAYIRKAFAPLVKRYADNDVVNTLNAKMNALFKTIPDVFKGEKKLLHADISQLTGFEFNRYTSLQRILPTLPSCKLGIDGDLAISLNKYVISQNDKNYKSFKCLTLQLMVFNFDLVTDHYELFTINDLNIDLRKPSFAGAKVVVPTQQQSQNALIVALGATLGDGLSINGDRRYYACQLIFAGNVNQGQLVYPERKVIEKPINPPAQDSGLSWEILED